MGQKGRQGGATPTAATCAPDDLLCAHTMWHGGRRDFGGHKVANREHDAMGHHGSDEDAEKHRKKTSEEFTG